jgi:hypothetical protein
VRSGGANIAPYSGPVSIHAMGEAPVGTYPIGGVDVSGTEDEASIEDLMPVFLEKVAQLGGNAAVIERVDTEFHTVVVPQIESYSFPCGYGRSCIRSRTYLAYHEVMTLHLRGRAFSSPTPIDTVRP